MDAFLRATAIYFLILFLFRMSGHRTLGQTTTFDLALVLIISETTQQALLGDDKSITFAFLSILTMLGWTVVLGFLKNKSRRLEDILEGKPIVLVRDGKLDRESMKKERIEREDLLQAARQHHGLSDISEVKHAILEKTGEISIIPR